MAQVKHISGPDFEKLTKAQKYDYAEQLGTTSGFYQFYFDSLPAYNTQTDCFNNANDIYYSIFKQYKYSDYNVFRNCLARHYK